MKTEKETPKQDIIEFLCGSGTYDGYQWQEATRDKRPYFWWRTKLLEHVNGLQSRVSELEAENSRLEKEVEELRATIYELRKNDVRLPLD